MEDLIRRSDAIAILKDLQSKHLQFCLVPFRIAIEKVQAVPSADRPQGWIPCSEMLPRARESVLIAVNHKYGDWVGEGCYWETTDNHIIWKGYRWNATYWDDEIIAWMPLPKPWKGADDETD